MPYTYVDRCGVNSQGKTSYLSPFVCYDVMGGRPDMAASESNLSSSGYSSMASPGPSPTCSSRTLCILEEDGGGSSMHHSSGRLVSRKNMLHKNKSCFHAVMLSPSLESSSPPDSPVEKMLVSDAIAAASISMKECVASEGSRESLSCAVHHEKLLLESRKPENGTTAVAIDEKTGGETLLNATMRVRKSVSLDSKLVGQRKNNIKVRIMPRHNILLHLHMLAVEYSTSCSRRK